ncbi:hypothetical protein [Microlunatus parietis]|uniref:Uncharacterized protein n=1 Tax=Microlunatus parietis TaxID=682979 RepID=A0A7Y9LCA2_9ACTN|nr:hypothetical protein [Microlunatus parietis]NYE72617.1 hypothetical protein [Microlunatus parietis]
MIDHRSSGPTEVLIVGMAHLTADVPDAAIAAGRDRLLAWRPDLIAIENLPGHLVVEYEERGGAFADFPVGGAAIARACAATVSGLRPWSVWRARRVALDVDASLTDRVIGWLLAREPENALLLPWREADLPVAAVEALAELEQAPSERIRVGVAIARELGHPYLVHFDDHAGVELLEHCPDGWDDTEEAYYRTIREGTRLPAGSTDHDHWRKWVDVGTSPYADYWEHLESGGRAGYPDPSGVVRVRLAQWRTRNLAMAARLREATGLVPGGRVLAVVGSAHARPLRAALATDQHDLKLLVPGDLENLEPAR